MSNKANEAVVRRFYEQAWNSGDLDSIDETHEADYISDRLPSWRAPGAQGLKEFIKDNHRMFPDVRFTIHDIFSDGNKVAVRVSATATHKGDLNGPVGLVKATGIKTQWHGLSIFELHDGKITHSWGINDNMDLMQQLGAIPRPE